MHGRHEKHRFVVGKYKGEGHLGNQGVAEKIILKQILKKYDRPMKVQTLFFLLRIVTVTSLCKQSSEHSGPVKAGNFFVPLNKNI
jgi:hypothetical protein